MLRVLMTGGGTAGHIVPALAIADKIKEKHPDAEILFVGAKGRMETKLVPDAGYPIQTVDVRGFQRRLSLKNIGRNLAAAYHAVAAGWEAGRIIRQFQPDIAIGTGGYVSGPVLRKAAKMGIPIALHESNAFPGITVKMLARQAAVTMIATEAARKHLPPEARVVVTGNPVRTDFLLYDREKARRELGLDDRPLVLSFGGSLGAENINRVMTEVLAQSYQQKGFQHIHAAGKKGYPEMKAALEQRGVPINGPDIWLREYIDDMPRCMAAADVAICRCGAMTLSELPVMGLPAILIPSPYVAENHQYHNAMVLVNQGAALCIEEKDLTATALWQALEQIMQPGRREQMSHNARKLAIYDAADRIYAELAKILKP